MPERTLAVILKVTVGKRSDYYRVVRIDPNPKVAKCAFRLQKPDGTFHDVHENRHGWQCDCRGAHVRENKGLNCRHVDAVKKAMEILG
jgi:hypothetical protein